MKKIKVEMIGSKIREKNTTKKVLQALGLKKIGQKREYPYNEAVLGMIKKVIHLVKYTVIEEEKGKKVKGKKSNVKKEVKKIDQKKDTEQKETKKEEKLEKKAITEEAVQTNENGGTNETE